LLARLEDLAGQADVARRLGAALASGRLHHALLLAGPDGVGKFQAALLLARIAFCRAGDPSSACGQCRSCVKFETGHGDVHVLSANEKGLIPIDDVREVIRVLHVKPLEAPHKVLIVRDADTMNPQAQNALLKTLEEPPGRARIILTSSRPSTFLVTILSRCQRVDFRPVPSAELARLVAARLGLPEDRAALLAALAQGSPARAFDAEPDAVIAERDRMAELDLALSPGRRAVAAHALERAAELGGEKEQLPARLDLLGVWLRDQILIAAGVSAPELANLDRRDELERLAGERGLYEVLERTRAVQEARSLLARPYHYNPVMILEQLCLSLAGHRGSPS
jgi:DNA polymerase-3 subunit delta'